MSDAWPQASLGNIRRLRVLAAAFPGMSVRERSFAAPFDLVWNYFSDLERSIPAFDETVSALRIVSQNDSRLVARASNPWLPFESTLDVDLDPGWCLMTARPRYYVVAFAAEPDGDHTRFAHAEACSVIGPVAFRRPIQIVLYGLNKWVGRHVERDLDGLQADLGLND
jgi:hypothetical protein